MTFVRSTPCGRWHLTLPSLGLVGVVYCNDSDPSLGYGSGRPKRYLSNKTPTSAAKAMEVKNTKTTIGRFLTS